MNSNFSIQEVLQLIDNEGLLYVLTEEEPALLKNHRTSKAVNDFKSAWLKVQGDLRAIKQLVLTIQSENKPKLRRNR